MLNATNMIRRYQKLIRENTAAPVEICVANGRRCSDMSNQPCQEPRSLRRNQLRERELDEAAVGPQSLRDLIEGSILKTM